MPSYLASASRDAHAIFGHIDTRKRKRHEFGTTERGHALIPFGFNHRAGLGPDPTVDWYRQVSGMVSNRIIFMNNERLSKKLE